MADDWTDDIEEILSKVRQNCIDMYKYHLCRYFQYKRILPIFRVPVLILNALNSVFSVGLQPYMEQSLISVLNCLISLIATLINSIEMYMGIQKSMESEMSSSQGFYILSIGIYKTLTLSRENRDVSGKQYLMECYNTYSELVRNSKLIKDPYMLQKDFLQTVDRTIGGIAPPLHPDIHELELHNVLGNSEMALEHMAMKAIQQPQQTVSSIYKKPIQPSAKDMGVSITSDIENKFPGLEEVSFMPQFSVKNIPIPLLQPLPQPPPLDTHLSMQSPYPRNILTSQKRPSFADPHDPLYELSRPSIFGGPRKSTFLEMAGVTLDNGDSMHLQQPQQTLEGSFRSIFSSKSAHPSPEISHHHSQHHPQHHSQHHHHNQHAQPPSPYHYTNTQHQVHLPSQTEQLPRNQSVINLEQDLSTNPPYQPQKPEPEPELEPEPTIELQQSPPLQPPQQPQLPQPPKEKGVRDIVQEIESKPKKDVGAGAVL